MFTLRFICLTSMVVNIDSAGRNDKRIERLEDQLFNIEEKNRRRSTDQTLRDQSHHGGNYKQNVHSSQQTIDVG